MRAPRWRERLDLPVGRLIAITVVVTIVIAFATTLVAFGMEPGSVVGTVTATLGATGGLIYRTTRRSGAEPSGMEPWRLVTR